MKPLRVLSIPDTHEPYHIDLKPVLDFCDDWNPDVLQYLGDTTNAESVNHWKMDRGYTPDVASVEADYENLEKNILLPFKRACPGRTAFVYHLGNHEDWFYQAMLKYAWLKNYLGLEHQNNLQRYRLEIIKLNGFKNFGHLYFTHGNYATGDHHAKKMVLHYRKNLRYGHKHDKQEYFIQSPLDANEKMSAASVGCLCDPLKMDYLKQTPQKWVNSFHIAYINSDGTFNDYTTVITNGRFVGQNGKSYG